MENTNPTIEILNQRRSIRLYKNEPLTEEEKQIILHATMRAPTAGNMMLYSVIEVTDQHIKDDLAKSKEYIMGIYNPPTGITLSYPTGATNAKVMKAVEEAGYIAAVSGHVGVNTDTTPFMALRRVNIFNYRKMQKIEMFKLAIVKAQLKSWSASHGLDLVGIWDRLRGNAKS